VSPVSLGSIEDAIISLARDPRWKLNDAMFSRLLEDDSGSNVGLCMQS
jgi:hypothetical protein